MKEEIDKNQQKIYLENVNFIAKLHTENLEKTKGGTKIYDTIN